MTHEIAAHRNRAEIVDIAEKIEKLLATAMPGDAAINKTAFILAQVLKAQDSENFELRSFSLEHLLDAYIGQALTDKLQDYLTLHAELEADGATSFERHRKFRRREYSIYALPTQHYNVANSRDALDDVTVKALVLHTLAGNYLVVLNRQFGQWTVHFRQFWPSLQDALQSPAWLCHLDDYRTATNLSLLDVIKLSSAVSDYADDVPDVRFPTRLSLATFLSGRLIAGEEGECSGLRYGDGRDKGFIASLHNESRPIAQTVCESHLHTVHLVGTLLRLAKKPLNAAVD